MQPVELSIDTASEMASVALSREGQLLAEITWRCRRNHSAELLPTIDKLLAQVGASKADLTAVFVCSGPGLYTGLRVGVSTAKGLAYALALPLIGVGRLELDAYPHAAYPGPIVPLHAAGRGELAWAAYQTEADDLRETLAPRLSPPDDLLRQAPSNALFCGEVSGDLAQAIGQRLPGARVASPAASVRRAAYLAALGHRRLASGQALDPAALRPIYLRQAVQPPSASA